MPEPERTQKQVAEKYKGNLDYYHRGHFFRRLRWIAFVIVAVGSVAFALSFGKWGKPAFFSTGPISQNHAQLVHDCNVCHEKSQPDLTRGLGLHEAAADPVGKFAQLRDWIARAPAALDSLRPAKFTTTAEQALKGTSLADMDRACIKCHDPQRLHQPQAAALALRRVYHEMPMVFSGACANCHREHVTSARMALPRSEACATCHNDSTRLAATSAHIREEGPPLLGAAAAELADGQRHFVMPRTQQQPVAFKSFAEGHPHFAYEQPGARDPGTIKFNHARHFEADIPPMEAASRLDCRSLAQGHSWSASTTSSTALCHEPSSIRARSSPARRG